MSDVPTAPRPAMPVAPEAPLPSRAAPLVSGPYSAPHVPKVRARKKAPKKRAPTRAQKAKEFQGRYLPKRKKSARRPAFQNAAPKNPNRPLELKTQLASVLALLPGMKKPEVEAFTAAMGQMQALSRSGRRRVLMALGQVYP